MQNTSREVNLCNGRTTIETTSEIYDKILDFRPDTHTFRTVIFIIDQSLPLRIDSSVIVEALRSFKRTFIIFSGPTAGILF